MEVVMNPLSLRFVWWELLIWVGLIKPKEGFELHEDILNEYPELRRIPPGYSLKKAIEEMVLAAHYLQRALAELKSDQVNIVDYYETNKRIESIDALLACCERNDCPTRFVAVHRKIFAEVKEYWDHAKNDYDKFISS